MGEVIRLKFLRMPMFIAVYDEKRRQWLVKKNPAKTPEEWQIVRKEIQRERARLRRRGIICPEEYKLPREGR